VSINKTINRTRKDYSLTNSLRGCHVAFQGLQVMRILILDHIQYAMIT